MSSSVFNIHLVVVAGLTSLMNPGVSSLSLTCDPTVVQIYDDPKVTFKCKADVPLDACQFHGRDSEGKSGPIYDLSRGHDSVADPQHFAPADRPYSTVTGYSYSGQGLNKGSCGITLTTSRLPYMILGCRVKAKGSGWTYAWMEIGSRMMYNEMTSSVYSREVVVLPGEDVGVLIRSQFPLYQYLTIRPSMVINKNTYTFTNHSGSGDGRDVIVSISRAGEADNGPYFTSLSSSFTPMKVAYRTIIAIVARQPTQPVLSVSYEGADMTATCTTGDSRPVAQITWRLGDDIIRQDVVDDSPTSLEDKWSWPWDRKTITQTVSRTMTSRDQGKMLKCQVSHITMGHRLEASRRISFTAPNTLVDDEIKSLNLRAAQANERAAQANTQKAQADAQVATAYAQAAQANEKAALAKAQKAQADDQKAQAIAQAVQANEKAAQARTQITQANTQKVQADAQAAQANTKAALAKKQITQANTNTAQANNQITQANTQKAQADKQAAQANTKAALANKQITEANRNADQANQRAAQAKALEDQAKAQTAQAVANTAQANKQIPQENAQHAQAYFQMTQAQALEAQAKDLDDQLTAQITQLLLKSAEARARESEAWARHADEELQWQRARRLQTARQFSLAYP